MKLPTTFCGQTFPTIAIRAGLRLASDSFEFFKRDPTCWQSLEDEDDEAGLETGDVRGNCPRKWSQHLYFKLFLDVEGRNSPMLVVKCDVTCVNVFTDVELVLYKSRFIGGF